ncbi:hypothetical protein PPERSA_00339 [Pseudocohnilembus persalinus]|uniref:Uncharacterized protein n=1 Tax=Pseudocohnilembus persalinus TaxID=266149 RepID=A0A0V0QYA3_PSEPJ|nr:hypothetical protein PPERSA_00339 [Pseudocohnilembus persalinus]|eukprot:KRX07182.1 hypothetical protein PPERSA_00339 [Pseudocohnilembus persalinus]
MDKNKNVRQNIMETTIKTYQETIDGQVDFNLNNSCINGKHFQFKYQQNEQKFKQNYLYTNEKFIRDFNLEEENIFQNMMIDKDNQVFFSEKEKIQNILDNSYYINKKQNKKQSVSSIIQLMLQNNLIVEEKKNQQDYQHIDNNSVFKLKNLEKDSNFNKDQNKGSKINLQQTKLKFPVKYMQEDLQVIYNYEIQILKTVWGGKEAVIISFMDIEKVVKNQSQIKFELEFYMNSTGKYEKEYRFQKGAKSVNDTNISIIKMQINQNNV